MPPPRLIVFPSSDRHFERVVLEAVHPDGTPERLQKLLRARYPKAVVRPRDLAGEWLRVWYVYRGRGLDGVLTAQ